MKLYDINKGKISSVKIKPFKLEKEIQSLVEENIDEFFNLEFVKSELTIKSFRIDSLCYDKTNGSFVIIEYKNTKNYSVIDQGLHTYHYFSIIKVILYWNTMKLKIEILKEVMLIGPKVK